MFEKLKTAFLFILVLNSLLLSSVLWFKQTGIIEGGSFKNNNENIQIGKVLQLPDLLQPTKVLFHHGNGQHTCALPESAVYQSVKKDISHWNFTKFSLVQFTNEQWTELVNHKKGMEVQLPLSTSVELLPSLFSAVGLSNYVNEISRIWIYVNAQTNTTNALFLSDKEKRVVLASSNITLTNLNKYYFSFEKDWNLPSYHAIERVTEKRVNKVYKEITYIPRDQQELSSYKYFFIPITPQQGVKFLFGDPGVTHQVVEKDGTLYYTDGMRVLKIPNSLRYFDYFAPAPINDENSPLDELAILQEIVSFINDHGGFGGDYELEKREQNNYVFRERVGSFPLYGETGTHQIYIRSDFGKITAFKRPLFYLDTYFEKVPVTIQSSSELMETLKKENLDKKLAGVELGYQTLIHNDYMEMVPVWVIRQEESSFPVLIPASVPPNGIEGGK